MDGVALDRVQVRQAISLAVCAAAPALQEPRGLGIQGPRWMVRLLVLGHRYRTVPSSRERLFRLSLIRSASVRPNGSAAGR